MRHVNTKHCRNDCAVSKDDVRKEQARSRSGEAEGLRLRLLPLGDESIESLECCGLSGVCVSSHKTPVGLPLSDGAGVSAKSYPAFGIDCTGVRQAARR
jgi:hypothetical protein